MTGRWTSDRRLRGLGLVGASASVLAVVLLGGCTSSGHAGRVRPTPAPPTGPKPTQAKGSTGSAPTGGTFVVRFEDPAPADRQAATLLRDRAAMEAVAEALNDFLVPGREITLVGRSCAGAGSAYDDATGRIEMCYDDISDVREVFEGGGRHPADEEVLAVVTEVLYHEAGHALVDTLDLNVADAAEEDVADRFAAFMELRRGAEGERQLRAVLEEYRLSAAEDDQTDEDATAAPDTTRDDTLPDSARAANLLCYLYGAAPDGNRGLLSTNLLPPERAAGCAGEWTNVRDTWLKDLKPALRTH
ncbi:DUF4344 domain-containing metallopeptidase [Embleya sp. NPDC020630]|uniref:DUF4344 domain-containing metallopeptidase n=1 Tax=Embleya sp. NPDC020630 TaxID=3363979 RepID=UPI003792282C